MSDGYKIRDQALPHFVTATVVDWIDVFTRKNYRYIVIACLEFCIKEKAMVLYGYIIMSNHIHMVCNLAMENYQICYEILKNLQLQKLLKR